MRAFMFWVIHSGYYILALDPRVSLPSLVYVFLIPVSGNKIEKESCGWPNSSSILSANEQRQKPIHKALRQDTLPSQSMGSVSTSAIIAATQTWREEASSKTSVSMSYVISMVA